ncbi:helix-turn-helix transcriptional regulator [Clostridium neuense]|uniref:Helix-turn-helix transcriptional regulator n=1 Tax=Clostridium neuense TaxID=1728934 RepID=A0ABW8TL08_9CLOT
MPIKRKQSRHLPAFILLTLAEGAAHGGAIYNSLMEKVPNFQCDQGAIYRALQKLEEDNAVTFSWDTTSTGPAKKIYSITDAGLNQLDDWKVDIEQRILYLKCFLDRYKKLKK